MEKYFCKCLNIIINATISGSREIDGEEFLEMSEKKDPFFSGKVKEVQLSISGVEVAQEMLSMQRRSGDWQVSCCLNCGVESHAVHSEKSRVLISSTIQHGSSKYEELLNSTLYSKIFKIKILENNSTKSTTSLHYKRCFRAEEKIEHLVSKAIAAEQDSMTERIRLFKARQEQEFMQFKVKAKKDQEAVMRTIRHFDPDSGDALFDSDMRDSHFSDSHFGEESRDKCTDLRKIGGTSGRAIPTKALEDTNNTVSQSLPAKSRQFSRSLHQTLSDTQQTTKKTSTSHSAVRRTHSNNDETLFNLDGFHDNKNCEPFFDESDDDSGSGDTASLGSSGGYTIQMSSRGMNAGDRVYATSVPINVDNNNRMMNFYEDTLDDDEPSPSPNHIAESIKALANSMQDSTAMFGELPRPRLNTNPYSLR